MMNVAKYKVLDLELLLTHLGGKCHHIVVQLCVRQLLCSALEWLTLVIVILAIIICHAHTADLNIFCGVHSWVAMPGTYCLLSC